MFEGRVHTFFYVSKYFSDKYGVRGSRFGNVCGRSKNVPKRIAIDQDSLISNFGIIKKTIIILNKQEKQKSPNICAVFWALLDPVLGPIEAIKNQ